MHPGGRGTARARRPCPACPEKVAPTAAWASRPPGSRAADRGVPGEARGASRRLPQARVLRSRRRGARGRPRCAPGKPPARGIAVSEGRCPYTPQYAAGTRIEPPMSLPISRGVSPAASAAPPLDPIDLLDLEHRDLQLAQFLL